MRRIRVGTSVGQITVFSPQDFGVSSHDMAQNGGVDHQTFFWYLRMEESENLYKLYGCKAFVRENRPPK